MLLSKCAVCDNVQCVKNENLLKSKKLVDYYVA